MLADALVSSDAAVEAPDFSGTWENGNGFEMELFQTGSAIRGRYRTPLRLLRETEEAEVVGFVTESNIVLSISDSENHSLHAWAGRRTQGSDGSERIHFLCYLAQNGSDTSDHADRVAGLLASSETFFRGEPGPEMEANS